MVAGMGLLVQHENFPFPLIKVACIMHASVSQKEDHAVWPLFISAGNLIIKASLRGKPRLVLSPRISSSLIGGVAWLCRNSNFPSAILAGATISAHGRLLSSYCLFFS
jgi:hypothetical protein